MKNLTENRRHRLARLPVALGIAQPPAGAEPPGPPPLAAPAAAAAPAPAAAEFNVRDYGAVGNGSTNDTAAINKAITAANTAGGGIVRFPSGTYESKNTIKMKSNVTLQLDAGSTISGNGADTYDPPESNQWDDYQDYGHSHFHNAMIYGDNLSNIGFTGSGVIDGDGALITGNPKSGEADKIISLTRCKNLTLSGITPARGRPLRRAHSTTATTSSPTASPSTRRWTATAGTSSPPPTSRSPTPISRPTTTRSPSRATTRSAPSSTTGMSPSPTPISPPAAATR